MRTLLTVTAVILIGQCLLAQEEIELAYDDGVPNLHLQFSLDGVYFVMRFTPPAVQTQIIKVRYYVADTSDGATCDLHIWRDVSDKPAVGIYGPVNIRAESLGWNEIDLTQHTILTDTDFYIGLSYDNNSKLVIGAESRSPSGRAYDTDC